MLIPTISKQTPRAAGRTIGRRRRLGRILAEPWPSALVARLSGLAIGVVAVAIVVWAFAVEAAPAPVPEYALGSTMLWRAERAAATILLAATLVIVLAHLLTGRLPRSVGREGLEWSEAAEDGGGVAVARQVAGEDQSL